MGPDFEAREGACKQGAGKEVERALGIDVAAQLACLLCLFDSGSSDRAAWQEDLLAERGDQLRMADTFGHQAADQAKVGLSVSRKREFSKQYAALKSILEEPG